MNHLKLTATFAALALSSVVSFVAETSNSANAKSLVDASKLDGTAVYDFHGNKLGDLQQVLIDPMSGQIRYGVVEVDKSWNWNDPAIAVPWGSFAVKRGDDKSVNLSLDTTKEKLKKAPKFMAGDADRLYDKQSSEPVYTYWSIYWYDPMPMNKTDASGKTTSDAKTSTGDTRATATDATRSTETDATAPGSKDTPTTK